MSERKTARGFFEFLVTSEIARLVIDSAKVAALGPFAAVVPVAGRAFEYFGPAVIRRMWLYIQDRPKPEAALAMEEVANLDAHTAWEMADEAGQKNPELRDAPGPARKLFNAVLAAIPAGLRQMLPRDEHGQSTCPVDALPRGENDLL